MKGRALPIWFRNKNHLKTEGRLEAYNVQKNGPAQKANANYFDYYTCEKHKRAEI